MEIDESVRLNYENFSKRFLSEISENTDKFRGNQILIDSYARIAALNAIKVDLVSHNFSTGSAHFFYEAHNDALLSHVNASFGSWRPALQALRSFFENTLAAVYFRDHSVELFKWQMGKFKISPRELREYAVEHPSITAISKDLNLKKLLDEEYATLSQAVHGSSDLFRMTTSDGNTNFAEASFADLGKWSTRERNTVNLCASIMVAILNDFLDGAKLPEVRKSLSLAILKNSRNVIKKNIGVNIPDP